MSTEINRVLTRIEKLVAMASSPHIEEARTSAFMACKLIRDYGLKVVACNANAHQETTHQSSPNQKAEPDPPNDYIPIKVKHGGYCLHCRQKIAVGEKAFWLKGLGLLHFDCA